MRSLRRLGWRELWVPMWMGAAIVMVVGLLIVWWP